MSTHYDVQALPAEQREHILRGFGLGWWRQLGQVAIVFGVVLLACWYVGLLDATTLLNGLPSIATLAGEAMPPDFSGYRSWIRPLIDTLAMSIAGTAIAVVFSLVVAFVAARNTAPHPLVFGVARVLLNALRSVPELIMGIIFVAAVGFGALPGVLARSAFGRHGQQVLRRGHRARRRSAGGSRSGGGGYADASAAARGFATGDAAVRRRGDLPLGIQLSRLHRDGHGWRRRYRLRTHGLAAHHAVPGGCSNPAGHPGHGHASRRLQWRAAQTFQIGQNMLPKLVITHRVHDEILQLLAPHCELVTNQTDSTLTREEILRRCRDAQAMMAFMPDRVDADFLQACPELRVVGCALKGFDNFDVDACTARGVWLTFVPDLLTVPTAELAIGLAVGLGRHLRAADAFVRSGEFQGWQPQFYGTGLDNATVGILGMGAIGLAMAERLQGWGATLQYHEAKALDTQTEQRLGLRQVACSELFASSDFILLALPLNADTQHLVNAELLALVRPGALLVNPCRGSVVDEAAVLAALERGQLGGYAADVFEMEDWARADRPRLIDPALLAHPNTLFTPHIGSAVRAVRLEIERCAAQNIIQVLAGARPINAANRLPKAEPAAC